MRPALPESVSLQSHTNKQRRARRRFLRLLVAISTVVPVKVLLAVPGGKSTRQISIRSLGPYLDTLIPEDESPSATRLGVEKPLVAVARANPRLARLIALGCEWLDQQGHERGKG